MKKTILLISLLSLILSLTSCKSKKDKIKESVTSYLANQMKNPDSFKILSIEIREDTVPLYLSNDILLKADKTKEAFDEYNRYKDRSYLWADEKYESMKKFNETKNELEESYNSAKYAPKDVENIVYVKSTGTNSVGGTISNSFIIIVDKENPSNILGMFYINKDFLYQYMLIKTLCEKYNFNTNKFGKYEVEGLPFIDQFIINEIE